VWRGPYIVALHCLLHKLIFYSFLNYIVCCTNYSPPVSAERRSVQYVHDTVANPEEAVVPLGTAPCCGSERERAPAGCDTLGRCGGTVPSGRLRVRLWEQEAGDALCASAGRCAMLRGNVVSCTMLRGKHKIQLRDVRRESCQSGPVLFVCLGLRKMCLEGMYEFWCV
jgi:hypothetical protein